MSYDEAVIKSGTPYLWTTDRLSKYYDGKIETYSNKTNDWFQVATIHENNVTSIGVLVVNFTKNTHKELFESMDYVLKNCNEYEFTVDNDNIRSMKWCKRFAKRNNLKVATYNNFTSFSK